jgi:TPR repeat protein
MSRVVQLFASLVLLCCLSGLILPQNKPFTEEHVAELDPDKFQAFVKTLNAAQIKEYEASAERGDPKAQLIVGLLKIEEAKKIDAAKDYARYYDKKREAASWYQKAAEQNYAPAQYFLALQFESDGLHCDDTNKWMDKAVAAEYRAALHYKGYFYETKRCVEQDYAKAIALYKRASNLGFTIANYSAGEIYDKGLGVPENQKEATVWFLKAAEQGGQLAQNEIGIRISEGIGTKANNNEAVQWFKKSAEQGNVFGACNLALHYARGRGVAKNPLLSLKWMYISHSLDGLKCFPNDFIEYLKPTKTLDNRAWQLAVTWLRRHPDLENNFDERPWMK